MGRSFSNSEGAKEIERFITFVEVDGGKEGLRLNSKRDEILSLKVNFG